MNNLEGPNGPTNLWSNMTDNDVRDLIIIGGGPAGYTAALYAARANLKPLVIEGMLFGGQLMITSDVENYPGYPEGVLGPEMMKDFRSQAERFGAEFLTEDVTSVDFSERPFTVEVDGDEYRARAVIVATGASARQLGLDSEKALQGRGVSYCAVCDAAFFKEKDVVVVGGGDSAMEEATFLTKFAKQRVYRAPAGRVPCLADHATTARGPTRRSSSSRTPSSRRCSARKARSGRCAIRDLNTGETSEIPAQGLFVAVGHDPEYRASSSTSSSTTCRGTSSSSQARPATNIHGVFAAGDVVDHTYRQAVTAAGTGAMAALDAERLLAAEEGTRRPPRSAPRTEAETAEV